MPFAFKNVKAIAPPISILSALFNRFSITPILSETFDPPSIAINGCFGSSSSFAMMFISFSTKKPSADGINLLTPTFDA